MGIQWDTACTRLTRGLLGDEPWERPAPSKKEMVGYWSLRLIGIPDCVMEWVGGHPTIAGPHPYSKIAASTLQILAKIPSFYLKTTHKAGSAATKVTPIDLEEKALLGSTTALCGSLVLFILQGRSAVVVAPSAVATASAIYSYVNKKLMGSMKQLITEQRGVVTEQKELLVQSRQTALELKGTIERLDLQVKEGKGLNETLSTQIAELTTQMQEAKRNHIQLQQHLEQTTQHNHDLNIQVEATSRNNESLQANMAHLQVCLQSCEKILPELKKAAASEGACNIAVVTLEKHLETQKLLDAHLKTTGESFDDKIQHLTQLIRDIQDNKVLSQNLAALSQAIAQLVAVTRQHATLEAQAKLLQQQVAALQKQIEELKTIRQEFTEERTQLTTVRNSLMQTAATMEEAISPQRGNNSSSTPQTHSNSHNHQASPLSSELMDWQS